MFCFIKYLFEMVISLCIKLRWSCKVRNKPKNAIAKTWPTKSFDTILIASFIKNSFSNNSYSIKNYFSQSNKGPKFYFFSMAIGKKNLRFTESPKSFERKPFGVFLIIKNHRSFKNTHESSLIETLQIAFI